MENDSKTKMEDIINLNAVDSASQPAKRETTMHKKRVLLTKPGSDRFVSVTLPDGKEMDRIATSPREIEWSACATLLKDRCMVISPWRGAEQGRSYTIGNYKFTLPYPIMGIRAASVREMAFLVENQLGSTRLPREYSGPRRAMVPRDKQDKSKTARNYRTYPVHTDGFVEWFAAQLPELWPTFSSAETRPPTSWMVLAETIGPWGKTIGDDWLSLIPKKGKGGEK